VIQNPASAPSGISVADDGAPAAPHVTASADKAPTARPSISGPKLDPKSRLLFYLMRAMLHLLSLLPDFVLYPLGMAGGWLGYILDRHVRIGLVNLAIAFPEHGERERRRILRASYINLGRSAAEYIRLGGFFHSRLIRRVAYDRFEYWDEIKRQYPGRGIVVLSAHFGNFELLPAAHAMHGHQIGLVHHTQRFLAGDALMNWVRVRAGIDILRKHSAARAMLKALGDGQLVGVPFDQNAKRGEAIFVPFFGEPAATSRTLARLVRASRAVVAPVFIVRQPDGRSHRIVIKDLIPLVETQNTDADVEENTRRFVGAIEEMVLSYPEQFLWTHRRYRTRPRGMPPLYGEVRHRRSRPPKSR
jgi:KDO2-lipid IV(A) lauroyltransferase